MTYISSFYRNIQKEFQTKEDKKSKLVRAYEYFDRTKRNQSPLVRKIPDREPKLRKIQAGTKLSFDLPNR